MGSRSWKKGFSFLLAVIMLFGMVPVNALAADEEGHVHADEGVPHEHQFTAGAVTAPSCTAEGYTLYSCECGQSEQRDVTAALGHSYAGQVCSLCGEAEPAAPAEGPSAYEAVTARAEALLAQYALTPGMDEEAMAELVVAMELTAVETAAAETAAVQTEAAALTAEEQSALYATALWQTLDSFAAMLELARLKLNVQVKVVDYLEEQDLYVVTWGHAFGYMEPESLSRSETVTNTPPVWVPPAGGNTGGNAGPDTGGNTGGDADTPSLDWTGPKL